MKLLVTGTLGFIFSNFVRKVLDDYPTFQLVGVDKAVKDYNLDHMLHSDRYHFHLADIADAHIMDRIFTLEKPDIVIGGAAESFVDDSITDIMPFLHSNVIGTQTVVNCCLKHKVKYLHISTDEVYGQQTNRDDAGWLENQPLAPRNPYAASKAAAELVVKAAHETHGLVYQMTRSCNVYGPRQKKLNLIPQIIDGLIHDRGIPIHGSGLNFRQYIYVDDKIDAIMRIIERGKTNTVYNIGDSNIISNTNMVQVIATKMKRSPIIHFVEDRKAHDFGYKVRTDRLNELGWRPQVNFDTGMERTITYYLARNGNV